MGQIEREEEKELKIPAMGSSSGRNVIGQAMSMRPKTVSTGELQFQSKNRLNPKDQ
jgi:hypothetical protein